MSFKQGQQVVIKNLGALVGTVVAAPPGAKGTSRRRSGCTRYRFPTSGIIAGLILKLYLCNLPRVFSPEWNSHFQCWIEAGHRLVENPNDREALAKFSEAGRKLGFVVPVSSPVRHLSRCPSSALANTVPTYALMRSPSPLPLPIPLTLTPPPARAKRSERTPPLAAHIRPTRDARETASLTGSAPPPPGHTRTHTHTQPAPFVMSPHDLLSIIATAKFAELARGLKGRGGAGPA